VLHVDGMIHRGGRNRKIIHLPLFNIKKTVLLLCQTKNITTFLCQN